MSSEESNKMSKQTPSQDSHSNPRPEEEIAAQLAYAANSEWLDKTYNDLVETGNDYSPDVTDMLWTAAKKEAAQERLHDDIRKSLRKDEEDKKDR